MEFNKAPRKLWEHPDPKSTPMWAFLQETNRRHGLELKTFNELYAWSCANRASFYAQLWDFAPHIHEGSCTSVVDEAAAISQLPAWFEGVRINWAENHLYTASASAGERTTRHKEDGKIALTEVREGNSAVRHVTWAELRRETGRLAAAMAARGVTKGDRVVMVGGHSLATLVVFLATTWLGGVFSASSTDMGVGGLLQRTAQVNPKFVFFDDGALYNGKVIDLRDKIRRVMEGIKAECDQLEKLVIVQRFDTPYDTSGIPLTERLEQFLAAGAGKPPPAFVRVAFQDPLMVFFSSGTTGTPKAIVHGVGPVLLSHSRDSILHRGVGPGDTGLQYTTTGWIMYMSSVAIMLNGGRAVLYDGSPFVPDLALLLRMVEEHKVTLLGVGPRWMGELMKNKVVPREVADLSSLRLVASTGMVLPDQAFEWFYDEAFPRHVLLGNMTGGTDIAGCFALDNPLDPLFVGGCMNGALGVPIAVFDPDLADGSSAGTPLAPGTPGDLVATAAFPNVPVRLWNDGAGPAPGPKYHAAYFARFAGVWAQGDFCAIHPTTRAVLMLGRSDGVLNPGGVRFGSADIYAVLERCFAAEVAESLCVGQRRPADADETVVLFLLMRQAMRLERALVVRIKETIARELTKRHVPKYVFEMPEVPTTVNGKKVELPVKKIISGQTIKPSGTLLNPESLDFFYRFQKIEELVEPQAKL